MKAIVSKRSRRRRGGAGPEMAAAAPSDPKADAESVGLEVEAASAEKTVVSGEEKRMEELEQMGYRVKPLRDTHILNAGDFQINIEEPELEVESSGPPMAMARAGRPWTQHLVQLIAPPEEEWIKKIENRGVDVVEPISAYGLFVHGDADDVEGLRDLEFVAWTGPFKPEYKISPELREPDEDEKAEIFDEDGVIRYVNIGIYPPTETDAVLEDLEPIGATVVNQWDPAGGHREKYQIIIVEATADTLSHIAEIPSVRWLEYHAGRLEPDDDERAVQILVAALNGTAPPETAPVAGYVESLAEIGLDGEGVTIGICDTGVDTNDNATMHPDLKGRLAFAVDRTEGIQPVDEKGHGTHVAGIALGSAETGEVDSDGFALGQGVAPKSLFGSVNAVAKGGYRFGSLGEIMKQMTDRDVDVMNNSWAPPGLRGYSAIAALLDRIVRDPDPASPEPLNLAIVFSAGNKGPGDSSIASSKEAKNIVTVGNSHNFRPDELSKATDIRGVFSKSSRGPARDGRILPTIVAPGTDIVSSRSLSGNNDNGPLLVSLIRPYKDPDDVAHPRYAPMTGTSMAAPHVTGLCALLIQWWRARNNGAPPSQAMLKALLINGAKDLAGGPDGKGGVLGPIPNNDQGWGRVNLKNTLKEPKVLIDQSTALTLPGDEFFLEVGPDDPARPLRVTLVWTDAPGTARQNPAILNDLDLEVVSVETDEVYKGNVFEDGFSVTGGTFDGLNNVECVYIREPQGNYEISVIAGHLRANANRPFDMAHWQDFALVIDNAVKVD